MSLSRILPSHVVELLKLSNIKTTVDLLLAGNDAILGIMQHVDARTALIEHLLQEKSGENRSVASDPGGSLSEVTSDSMSTMDPVNLVEFLKRYVVEVSSPSFFQAADLYEKWQMEREPRRVLTTIL